MLKLIAGALIGALMVAGIFGWRESRSRQLIASTSVFPELLKVLQAAERSFFDEDSLKNHHVPLLQDGTDSSEISGGALDRFHSEALTTGILAADIGVAMDSRSKLLILVRTLIELSETHGFLFEHQGFRCQSFGGGAMHGKGLIAVKYGSSNWWTGARLEPEDRYLAVYVQMECSKNPAMMLSWDILLDTQTRALSIHRWWQGRPVRYSPENRSIGKLFLTWDEPKSER